MPRRGPILSVLALVGALLFGGLRAGSPNAPGQGVLLEFWSIRCLPCAKMEPVVAEFARRGGAVRRIDVDQDPRAAKRFEIRCVPTFIGLVDGRPAARIEGPATVEQLAALCNGGRRAKGGGQTPGVIPMLNPGIAIPPPSQEDKVTRGQGDKGIVTPSPGHLVTPSPPAAVVRIVVALDNGETGYGSGAIVAADGTTAIVATAAHVLRGARRIEVVTVAGRTATARLLRADAFWDWAFVEFAHAGEPTLRIAERDPAVGDVLTLAGFSGGDQYRTVSGPLTQWVSPAQGAPSELAEVAVKTRPGDSGGPVWNAVGDFVGLLSACDEKAIVVALPGLRRALAEAVESGGLRVEGSDSQPSTLNPQPLVPIVRDPQPSTLNPQLSTPNPQPLEINIPVPEVPAAIARPSPPICEGPTCPLAKAVESGGLRVEGEERNPQPSTLNSQPSTRLWETILAWGATAGLAGLGVGAPPTAVYWGVRAAAAVLRRRRSRRLAPAATPGLGPQPSTLNPQPSTQLAAQLADCRRQRTEAGAENARLLGELDAGKAALAALESRLADAEASVTYLAPAADGGLATMRRAMKATSETYPAARPWVQMIERAYQIQRSGEKSHG